MLGWFGKHQLRARHRRQVIATIERAGGQLFEDGRINGSDANCPRFWPEPFSNRKDEGRFNRTAEVFIPGFGPLLGNKTHAELRIKDSDMRAVAELPCLRRVILDCAGLTSAGLSNLSQAKRLEQLSLCGLFTTDESINHIERLQNITTLMLYKTNVTSAGLEPVGRMRNLDSLTLFDNPLIGDEGLKKLVCQKNLRELRLIDAKITDNGLAHLRNLDGLRSLELDFCGITSAGIDHLIGLSTLRSLSLCGANIDEADIGKLSSLQGLDELTLCYTPFSDAAIPHVRKLRSLKRLFFNETAVTDAGFLALKGFTNLEELIVGPHVSKEAAIELKASLPNCEVRLNYKPYEDSIFTETLVLPRTTVTDVSIPPPQ
jgi:hypothetical protein